ncbi:MAG: hypothetical protein KC609_13285, partial [Myxococcales bacterium]|nr:hypothetical protein [Myxococcales bacterium]
MGPIRAATEPSDEVGALSVTIKRKLVFALLMIVLIPVGLIGWLGVRVAIEDQESVRRNLLNLLNSRLEDIRGQVTRTMEAIELELLKGLDAHYSTIEKLQTFETKNDLVRQTFLVDASGRLIYPNPKKPATLAERRFLLRTRSIWHQKAILDSSGGVREMPNLMPKKQVQLRQKNPSPFRRPNPRGRGDSIVDLAATRGFGWIDWYWAEGLHLLFWKRRIGGGIVGVEVDRIVLMSRIVGELPD